MEFGRIHDRSELDRIDLTLPAAHPRDRCAPRVVPATDLPERIVVGAPVWAARGFVGKVYPAGTPQRAFLQHYAQQWPMIELNTTWYRVDADQIEHWAEQTAADFEFCPKLPKKATHDLLLQPAADRELAAFAEAIQRFGNRLGPAWTITPPGFGPAEFPTLRRFVETWARTLRLAIELREPGWFSDVATCDAVVDLFREHGVSWILTDAAGRRDVLHMCRTAPEVMVRFQGNDLHATDFTRLDAWAERLVSWFDSGTERVRFCLHQPHEPNVVELAEHLASALEGVCGPDFAGRFRVPRRYDQGPKPRQGSLFG